MASAGTGKPEGRGGKRRRISAAAQEQSGWASLPGDMVRLVAARVLVAGDVVDHMSFRAVCSGWRASEPAVPRGAAGLARPLCPRGWVALCDGDEVRPDDALSIGFFHTRTGRRLRVRLRALRGHRIVGLTGGLLVLLHKRTTAVRVLHPFTRAALDLPPIAPAFRAIVAVGFWDRKPFLGMNAAVCRSGATIDVVAWFPAKSTALYANSGGAGWQTVHLGAAPESVLPFRDRLYACSTVQSPRCIRQVYPRAHNYPADDATPITGEFGPLGRLSNSFLVESDGRMLLAVMYYPETMSRYAFKVFEVDVDRRQLTPVSSLGNRALFLFKDRCLSVSANRLPSISGNSVYFSVLHGAAVYCLSSGSSKGLSPQREMDEDKQRVRYYTVRPFTLADHLVTYCNHLEWARGLMYHEYYDIPNSFEELHNKLKKQDSQLRIPSGVARRSKESKE